MKNKYTTVYYSFDEVDSELYIEVRDQDKKILFTEMIVGDFKGIEDVEDTAVEIAKGQGYNPVALVDRDGSFIPLTFDESFNPEEAFYATLPVKDEVLKVFELIGDLESDRDFEINELQTQILLKISEYISKLKKDELKSKLQVLNKILKRATSFDLFEPYIYYLSEFARSKIFKALGRIGAKKGAKKGGEATKAKYGKEHYKKIRKIPRRK